MSPSKCDIYLNNLDHKIYTYIYIYSDTQDTLYFIQVGIQGVSHIKYNANNTLINLVPCKRNNRHCVCKY